MICENISKNGQCFISVFYLHITIQLKYWWLVYTFNSRAQFTEVSKYTCFIYCTAWYIKTLKIHPLSNFYLTCQKHWETWVNLIKFNKFITRLYIQFICRQLNLFFLKLSCRDSCGLWQIRKQNQMSYPMEICTAEKNKSLFPAELTSRMLWMSVRHNVYSTQLTQDSAPSVRKL